MYKSLNFAHVDSNGYDSEEDSRKRKIRQITEVTTLFSTQDHGVRMQDSFTIDGAVSTVMGLDVPYIYMMSRSGRIGAGDDDEDEEDDDDEELGGDNLSLLS